MRRISRYGERETFDESQYCVTIINNNEKLSGHSVLVVEGVNDNGLFVGYYDILAQLNNNKSFTTRGYVREVRCYENDNSPCDTCTVPHENYTCRYDKCPKKCFSGVPREKVELMIISIKEDKETTNNYITGKSNNKIEYDIIDESSILGIIARGSNCAGWCIKKLEICDLCTHLGKPIPYKTVIDNPCQII